MNRPARGGWCCSRPRERSEEAARKAAWVVPVLALALCGIVFLLWIRTLEKASTDEGLARNKLRAAEQAMNQADFANALRELAEIPARSLTPELEARKQELEREVRAGQAETDLRLANASGTRYLDTLLEKYEARHLQGTPEPAKVRLFLERCRTFRARWPRHPEMDWVARQERRFRGHVDLDAPPTWPDVSWEVKDLTDGMPRNYVAALERIDELLTRVSGEEAEQAQSLRAELVEGRPAYAQDRLQQARYELEKKADPPKAVWWLVHNVVWLGDEVLADDSARSLVEVPDLAEHLLGYKLDYPERYRALMKNAVVASWAAENGFVP